MADAHDSQLPDLHPAAAAEAQAVNEPHYAPAQPPFVAAREFEGRIAPGNPWTARFKLVAASRVGVHVRSDIDAEYVVQFTDIKGRELFPPHRAPQSSQPAWFNVPAGAAKVAVSFPGNYSRMAGITVWLPSELAGIPGSYNAA